MKKQLFLLFFFFYTTHFFAQNSLTVSDVRNSWYTYQGTIEKATLSIRPQGLYMEYGLYLTFSARGVNFGTLGDSLEVVLNFSLPAGSIIHDSWLWVGDDIVKAHILDHWSATNIYEGIVKRRKDPSILTKQSATQYQLRVFPMHKASTRRVKITWLQPADLYTDRTEMSLPFHILQTSRNVVLSGLNLLVWPHERLKNPSFPDYPLMSFFAENDSVGGAFLRATFPHEYYSKAPRLHLSSPLQNGYYLSTRTEGGEGFYQLAFLPSQFVPQKHQKKVAILLDYEGNASAVSRSALLSEVKKTLLNELEKTDSFNLFFSNLVIGKAADRWIPAHPDTIQQLFAQLSNPLSDYTNLQPLLVAGIQWTRQHGPDGNILLVSNSTHLSNFQTANPLLNDITVLNQPTVPIHVVNFNQETFPALWIGDSYYYANAYFLYNLAGLNDGVYHYTLNKQSLASALTQGFSNLVQRIQSFDLYTSVADGFCYGRLNLEAGSDNTPVDRPLTQLGRFKGTVPFRVEMNGTWDDKIIHAEIEIPASDILPADTLIREMWYGKLVQTLESKLQTNNLASDIIFKSLSERVLSQYTAFLCLENPEWICDDCQDETQFTSTKDLAARDSMLTAFPNPFIDRTTIVVQLPLAKTTDHAALEIFSADGRLVRLFDLNLENDASRTLWDGRDSAGQAVPSGAYICMLRASGQTRAMRLMKM